MNFVSVETIFCFEFLCCFIVEHEHRLTTDNGLEMIEKLESLGVYGGGDCPEYAVSGLKRGKILVYINLETLKVYFTWYMYLLFGDMILHFNLHYMTRNRPKTVGITTRKSLQAKRKKRNKNQKFDRKYNEKQSIVIYVNCSVFKCFKIFRDFVKCLSWLTLIHV